MGLRLRDVFRVFSATFFPRWVREKKEKLEQLRWLENGYTIHSSIINAPGLGVDTDEDLKIIKRIMEK